MKKFFGLIFSYLLVFAICLVLVDKGAEVLFFSEIRSVELTAIFKFITFFGEWIGLVILGVFLLITNYRNLLYVLAGWLPLNLIMTGMKRGLNLPRPLKFFQNGKIVPLENVNALYEYSMPSGHTFTAFFLATFLATFFDLKFQYKVILFSIAIAVGISRIALLLHFKEDVFVGSMLGIAAGFIPMYLKKYRENIV